MSIGELEYDEVFAMHPGYIPLYQLSNIHKIDLHMLMQAIILIN